MTKYQLAKLILMAGGVESRKRVQKTVHLLQAAGCPLEMDFRLHLFGPYSKDLASLLDRLASNGVVHETEDGKQYNYVFSEKMRESLESFEATPAGEAAKAEMEKYQPLLGTLCEPRPRVLELASTIAFFYQRCRSWAEATAATADYKDESTDSPEITAARKLAETVVASSDR